VTEGIVTPTDLANKDVASLAAPDLVAARNEHRKMSIISRLVTSTDDDPPPAYVLPPIVEHVNSHCISSRAQA
jgi:hypothetical protein